MAIVAALMLVSACASAPLNLSTRGKEAFYAKRVVQALDALRDFAIDANAQVPPVLSENTTRKVVVYHKSILTVLGALPNRWPTTVIVGLDQLKDTIPATEYQKIAPYVALVKTLIIEVTQ